MAVQQSPKKVRASPSMPAPALTRLGYQRQSITSKDVAIQFVHAPSAHPMASQYALELKLSRAASPVSPLAPRAFSPYQGSTTSFHPASSPPIFLRRDGSVSQSPAAMMFRSPPAQQNAPQLTQSPDILSMHNRSSLNIQVICPETLLL
jgi:hypothetical protein